MKKLIDQEKKYYKKIQKIIPELALYKEATIEHLQDRAAKVGSDDLKQYYRFLKGSNEEQQFLKKNLTLKGTHFFRGDDWEAFNEKCLSQFAGKTDIRIWCAGCSSGEEAYSTIMSILDYVSLSDIQVLATDYNDELLEKCNAGSYANLHYEEIPEKYRQYVDKGPKRFVIKPELMEVVTTQNINLLTDPFPQDIDIIICRNVLKFFSKDVIRSIHVKMANCLRSGGILFVSADGAEKEKHAEFVNDPENLNMVQIEDRSFFKKL